MNRSCSRQLFILGPALLALVTLLFRSIVVARELNASAWISTAGILSVRSLPAVAFIWLLCLGISSIRHAILRRFVWPIATIAVGLLMLDTYVTICFGIPLSVTDLTKHFSAIDAISSFLGLREAILIFVLVAASCWTIPWPRRATLVGTSLVCGASALVPFVLGDRPLLLSRYDVNPFHFILSRSLDQVAQVPYSPLEMFLYTRSQGKSIRTYDLPAGNPPIILLVIESLAAVESRRMSGLHDRLPQFDRIANSGKFFTNFMANYSDSEGALISLLNGVPPLPYPGSTRLIPPSYERAPSVVGVLKERGYFTEALMSQSSEYTGIGDYLHAQGFDLARGRDEAPLLAAAPRFSFSAPADEVLYQEALTRINEHMSSDRPFFLLLITLSSHPPYIDPLGRGNTEDNVWSYVDSQFAMFYKHLQQSGFFSRGILLVTGDHRKFGLPSEEEQALYGASSIARIPLAIFGGGVPVGEVDTRVLQQTDLFPMLNSALYGSDPLTTAPIYASRYSGYFEQKGRQGGGFEVFDVASGLRDSVRGKVFGHELTWLDSPPPQAKEIERSIHSFRARLQASRTDIGNRCGKAATLPMNSPAKPGIEVAAFEDIDIGHPLDPTSSKFRGSTVTSALELNKAWIESLGLHFFDSFSLAYRGTIEAPSSGMYWFRVGVDDGVCLFVNGALVVDSNERKPFGQSYGSVDLEAGSSSIELRYFQGGGDADLNVSWIPPGAEDWQDIPFSPQTVER